MSFMRAWMIVVGLLAAASAVRAERFLTITDAQKLMFPAATMFESKVLRFTPVDIRVIERRSDVKVLRGGNRAWIARAGTNILGVVIHDQVLGKHEIIDYAVALSPQGAVQSVEILEYRESYGGEIRSSKWREQFKGKTARDPITLHRDIFNLSGATISCRNVSEGVKRVVATFNHLLRPHLPCHNSLPDTAQAGASR